MVRECSYSIHLITAVQVTAGVAEINWSVEQCVTGGFIKSMFTV